MPLGLAQRHYGLVIGSGGLDLAGLVVVEIANPEAVCQAATAFRMALLCIHTTS